MPVEERDRRLRRDDLVRSETIMVAVRWAAAAFALVQILTYKAMPYPPGHRAAALALTAGFVLVNAVVLVVARRIHRYRGVWALAVATLTIDVLLASGLVWMFAFDSASAHWAILFVIPLEGAARFGLYGAVGSWAAVTGAYVLRQQWAAREFGIPFAWSSIQFRMGLALLIAVVAGLLARDLARQRSRTAAALADREAIDRLRGRLVSALAHDIRSPLAAIRGSLQVLARPSLDDGTRTALAGVADRQADRLQRLASDLLDLARLEEGRLELSPEVVPLAPTVRNALSFLDPEEEVAVEIADDLLVRGDAARLEQVLANLVANAQRYGRPPVTVRACREGDEVLLEVLDAGDGVPEELRPLLFEPFAARAEHGSVGFGLWIVAALTQAHGGQVTYRPRTPTGACFQVRLPQRPADSG